MTLFQSFLDISTCLNQNWLNTIVKIVNLILFSLYSSALNLILLILFVSLTAGFILFPSLFSYITVNISNSIKIIHRIGIYNKCKKRSFLLNELIFQKITNDYLEQTFQKTIFLLNEQLLSKRILKKRQFCFTERTILLNKRFY